MKKLSCDIMKDLIPLYVDEVCSADTIAVVEEHIKECDSCNEYLQTIANTQLIGTKLEKQQVNYLKKINKSYVFSFFPMLFLTVGAILRNNGNTRIDYRILFIITFLFVIMSAFMQRKSPNREKQSILAWVFTILPIVYCSSVFGLFFYTMQNHGKLFGIFSLNEMGPFLDMQFIISMVIELFLYCYQWIKSITKQESSTANLIVNAAFAGMLLSWDYLLFIMSTPESVMRLVLEISITSIISALIGLFLYYLMRKKTL